MRDAGYRTQDEVEDWRRRDPIVRHRAALLERGIASESELQDVDEAVGELISEAMTFAVESPFPDLDTATRHIFREERGVACAN
jgi:pyruvate dehydrogenase E1 component alpha subunit